MDKFVRSRWKLEFVAELVTENNEHVRSPVVRTSTRHTKRSVVEPYPIEVNGKNDFVLANDSIDHVNLKKKKKQTCRTLSERKAVRANERIHKWINGQYNL